MLFARAGKLGSACGIVVAGLLLGAPARAAGPGVLGAYVRGPAVLIPGTQAAVRVATHRATSAAHSQPAAQVRVQATLSGGGHSQVLWTAVSDVEGRVDAHFQVPAWPPGSYALAITSQLKDERDVQTHKVQLAPSGKLLLQSDKPLYQPGQTVHLRTVAMRTQDGHPLTTASVRFELRDGRGNRVFTATEKLSPFGIAAADAVLADGILLGTYNAKAQLVGAAAEGSEAAQLPVEVARYLLPKIKLAVRTDRPYYRPGARVQLALDGRYFTDKPVAGGAVTVEAALQDAPDKASKAAVGLTGERLGLRLPTLHGKLDATGKLTLALELPGTLTTAESKLVLDITLTDSARQRQAVRQEVAVFKEALRLDVVAEAGELVPGMQSAVYVIAAYPDGAPAVGAAVELRLLGQTQTQTTDEIGVATFQSAAPGAKRLEADSVTGCRAGEASAHAAVRDHAGVTLNESRCLRVAASGGLLLRTDRAIYPSGAPLTLWVASAAPGDRLAYIDVWKDQQVVDTVAVPLHAGHGELTLPPSERRFGTLALQAYTILPDGSRHHDARLVYVDRPGALRIEVTPQPAGADFTPGEKGHIRLRVLDAQSGLGVQAALGVVMVDEALLALRPLRPGLLRTYFQLAEHARGAGQRLKARPAGYSVEKLVEEGAPDASRQLAARILLAGARPAWDLGWEVDPWVTRQAASEEQHERLSNAVTRFSEQAQIGERVGHAFRYRHDLVAALRESGLLTAADTRDPWRHPYTVPELITIASLPDFPAYAQGELDERMSIIYRGLLADQRAGRLPREPGSKPVIITLADVQRLAEKGQGPRRRLRDPWGGEFYLTRRPRPRKIAGLLSRYVLGTAGPDGVVGTKDDLFALEDACAVSGCGGPIVTGVPAAEAFDDQTMRGCGCGSGHGGGVGSGGSISSVVRGGTVGKGGVAAATDSVRSAFPETMLYLPQVLTDASGEASLDVAMADSITTWQLGAEAVALDGRLGATTLPVRVKQDFYVDLDLPPNLTQHDEVAVPVAVYNYLPTAQKVTLEVAPEPWFELIAKPGPGSGPGSGPGFGKTDSTEQVVDVAPGQVGLGYVRLRVLGHGQKTLTVRARGTAVHDAIARSVTVAPDGVAQTQSFAAQLVPGSVGSAARSATAEHSLIIPDTTLAGTAQVALKVYPALLTHAIEGLDSLLQVPHGCFEQTSSTTYPNALVLRFLQRTGKGTPAVEKKARDYLHAGYQRLLSFEVPGGGFSLFGQAPASKILTAYGLEEFTDMAKVYPVEPRVIERTQHWLSATQLADGSFAADRSHVLEDSVEHAEANKVRATAYIALALRHTDQKGHFGDTVQRAQAYVRRALGKGTVSDTYTLALVTELLAGETVGGTPIADALWARRKTTLGGGSTYFESLVMTPTHGRGQSATVETTAIAALALLSSRGPERLLRADQLIRFLISKKDPLGNFTSTQATVRTLKALLTYQEVVAGGSRGTLTVLVDGKEMARHKIGDDNSHVLDLAPAAALGSHRVTLRYDGAGALGYQLLARYYQPLAAALQAAAATPRTVVPEAQLVARIGDEAGSSEVRVGDTLRAQVTVTTQRTLDMPIITLGLPPGMDVDRGALDDGVRSRAFDKYELSAEQVVLYLQTLPQGAPVTFAVPLVARLPGRLAVPRSSVYEYYVPEERITSQPSLLTVREARPTP